MEVPTSIEWMRWEEEYIKGEKREDEKSILGRRGEYSIII